MGAENGYTMPHLPASDFHTITILFMTETFSKKVLNDQCWRDFSIFAGARWEEAGRCVMRVSGVFDWLALAEDHTLRVLEKKEFLLFISNKARFILHSNENSSHNLGIIIGTLFW